MLCVYSKILLSHEKWNLTIYGNMGMSIRCCTKLNKSDKDKHYMISVMFGIKSKTNENRLRHRE